jgi:lipopolysaccharide/colanic/teichoic acid biosynthesis glycosyltransferase
VIALVTLIVVSPLLPFVVAAIKLTSSGPVIYRQKRVGQNEQIYEVLKFRTMREDAENDGAQWATRDDPRVTSIGRFLRLTRIDEIPQLWNVLRGDMRFVGPRPERPEFVQLLAEQIPYYQLRHIVPPGITGWAQVRYKYGASVEDAKQKLTYDLYYIKHASLALDLLIVFETLKTILLQRGSQ